MYEKNYDEYDRVPPFGRPENPSARPHDTYGNPVPSWGKHPGDAPEYPHTFEPGYHLLPVPPAVWGMSAEQQILALGKKVDELVEVFNEYDRKVYGAHEAIVRSALHNDAYYNEITVEDGYIAETGAKYKVVHIPYLDRAGQPIYLELGLPSNSTLNEGLTENCFDASQRTLADKLIPAINKDTGYTGLALYKHAPIENMASPMSLPAGSTGWTLGITESGFLKVYDTANTTYEQMKWDKIRNAMGVVGLLVNQSKKAQVEFMSPDASQTVARTAIGMNYNTKERFIVVVEGDEEHGCLSDQLAEIFLRYNVNVAVETATQGSAIGMDKGEMMFMPPTASISLQADGCPNAPHLGAFWYITKRRHYHNDYVKDVAFLMQRLGQNIWMDKIYGHSVDDIEQGLLAVQNSLLKETEERKEKDNDLQSQLDEEKDTRLRVDNDLYAELHRLAGDSISGDEELGGKIGELRDELKAKIEERVQDLKKYIQSQDDIIKNTLEQYHKALDDYDIERVVSSVEGTKRTYRLIRKDGSDVQVPIEVYDYASLASSLGDIVAFNEALNNFKAEYGAWKAEIEDSIRDMKNTVTTLDARQTVTEEELASMKGTFATLQERMSALDRTVTSFQSQIVQMELAVENLKTAWAEYHTQWLQAKGEYEEWKAQVDEELAGIEEHINNVDSKVQEHDKKLDAFEEQIGDLSDKATAAEEKNNEQDTRLDELKKDQARQDTAFNAALDYTNGRHTELVEECQTYWQKFDQFEAKVREDQKNLLERLNGDEEDKEDLWNHMDTVEAGLKTEQEQTLKDAVHFAELEVKDRELFDDLGLTKSRVYLLEAAKEENDAKWQTQDEHNNTTDDEIGQLKTRMEGVEGKAQDNSDRLDSLGTRVDTLDGRLTTAEEHIASGEQKDREQDTKLDNLAQADTDINNRMDLIEQEKENSDQKDATQDSRIEALESQQSGLSDRMATLESEVHDINVDAYVQKTGDTMTGTLRVPEVELSEEIEFVADGTRAKVRKGTTEEAGNLVVADAVEDDEAVNYGQLKNEGATAESNANSYTDGKVAELEQKITDLQEQLGTLIEAASLFELSEDGTYVRTKNNRPIVVEGVE